MNKLLIIIVLVFSPTLFPQIYPDNIDGITVDSIFSIKIGKNIPLVIMETDIDSMLIGARYKIKIYDSTEKNLIQEIQDTLFYSFYFAAVKFIDINLDNYLDIALVNDISIHGDPLYHFWLYNPKTILFNYNSDYSELCCHMEIDTNKNEIFISYYDFSNISSEERHYKPYFNKPVLYKLRETEKLEGIDSILIKEYKMLDGELKIIKEYKVIDELGWE